MDIRNKNIILTGASSGIGEALLEIFVQYDNVKIIAVARHIENIHVSDKVYPFSADLSTQNGVDNLFEYATKTFGQIDIFIANAGFAYLEKAENPDWKHIEHIFSLNVFSPIYTLQKFISNNTDNKSKIFVSTISGAALISLPGYSLYCSTKAALHHFIETFRYESKRNYHLINVYPVATQTDFFDKASNTKDTPLPWPMQTSQEVAKKIVRAIEKNKKQVFPSLIFSLFYPVGRAFPIFLKLYSLSEKRKIKNWIDPKI